MAMPAPPRFSGYAYPPALILFDNSPAAIASSMADARKLRPRTPRQEDRKRASSVPASGSKRSGWLECVLVSTPLKRKRAVDDTEAFPASQPNPTIAHDDLALTQSTPARRPRSARGKSSGTPKKPTQSTARNTRKRTRKSPSVEVSEVHPAPSQARGDTEQVAESRGTGLLTPAPSSIIQTHGRSSASRGTRVPEDGPSSASVKQSQDKGKGLRNGKESPRLLSQCRSPQTKPLRRPLSCNLNCDQTRLKMFRRTTPRKASTSSCSTCKTWQRYP
ncbi:hypothetical protein OBBRIDRAFT_8668 [Obba rivulosa]|uniref:Uncharacterized protein n=1 Tax=Obba rivulosa TaxID=1052685 RepID=A0A8E2J7G3_9APHY|nr:hypothetical protein OBBRIDRAFT_8668 [Obba rivulosa]